ncbi:MAG: hypothetical protein MUD01_28865, partial [Chloroflexaceae bacterium]|nr:hypothetical protein [Chloroflexaceae bacterium]
MSGANFSLNNPLIHPMTNDTLTFTTMKYYVSNLKLKLADGSWWVHPESYFLVDASNVASSPMGSESCLCARSGPQLIAM